MRWEQLFADLAGQADALEVAERAAEVGERTRIELASVRLVDRVRGADKAPLRLLLAGGLALSGTVSTSGPDWLLLDEGIGREALIPLPALRSVSGLTRAAAVPEADGRVADRLTLRTALRGIARDRSVVRAHLVDGAVLDATLDRVGSDFVEIARHAAGEARRRNQVHDVVLVPFSALAAVRRDAG